MVLPLGYTGASYLVYDGVSSAKGGCWPQDANNTPDAFAVAASWGPGLAEAYRMPKAQDVVFHSRDAAIPETPLAAWWVPAEGTSVEAAPAVVVVHGIKSCRREASILLTAGMLHKHGYSVLIMDMRNHGDSGFDTDRRIAGGSDEYLDVLGGWDWVRAQGVPADRIGIAAFSFGSGVALTAGGEEPAVSAVWADSSFPITQTAIGQFLNNQLGVPDFLAGPCNLLVPGAVAWGRVNGIDFVKFDPVDEVAKYDGRHLAFVHGAIDATLPASGSTTLHDVAAAAGAHVADTWIVPGAGHTDAIYKDPSDYEQRLAAFFDGALREAAA
jgi:fermentation-respiration switch protein FrsA (DUF1100 family)